MPVLVSVAEAGKDSIGVFGGVIGLEKPRAEWSMMGESCWKDEIRVSRGLAIALFDQFPVQVLLVVAFSGNYLSCKKADCKGMYTVKLR